jgi:chromosome segregation ATPase
MSDALTDYLLADARSRREQLEEAARGSADENARIRRHLDAVRAAEASAAFAAREAGDRFADALEDLQTTLAIARHRLAAERTDNRRVFERAVEAELRDCSAYVERLQRRASNHGSADEQSGLAIADLRTRRDEAAGRLREMRAAPDETWRERRERLEAALDELEHAADVPTAATGREA